MLNITRADVVGEPFPHAVKAGILPPDLYQALRTDFPDESIFAAQDAASGSTGSRAGKGTGFDIYRGDDAYDRLIGGSPAWAELDAWINSPAFVEKFLEVFGEDLDQLGCSAEILPAAYSRTQIEHRKVLTQKQTLSDRIKTVTSKLVTREKGEKPVRLFSRLDIEKSIGGYFKPPHCDRKNRLCSLIIYFTDLRARNIHGGELNIYALKEKKPAIEHPRHPQEDEVDIVATVIPQENLGVFFPCSNNSYHGVNAVESRHAARDFLYINISTDNFTAW